MTLSRRDFLKTAARTAVAVPVVLSLSTDSVAKVIEMVPAPPTSLKSDELNLNVSGKAVANYMRRHITVTKISQRVDTKSPRVLTDKDKHIEVSIQLTAREMTLPSEDFIQQVAVPAAQGLVNMIDTYRNRFVSSRLELPEDNRICSIFENRGVSVRAMYGYDLTTQQSYITFDTYLIRVA